MVRRRPDESDIRIRPAKSTRRRSKDRPSHSDSIAAQVITVDRGRTLCRIASGKLVSAMKAIVLGKNAVGVGDFLNIVGDVRGEYGSPDWIVSVPPGPN